MIDFSCIIPTYKRESYVMEAIHSVLKYECQFSVEVIIIDDDPESNLSDKLDLTKIRYFKNSKRRGPGFSRKKGFNLSRGKYIIFMDDDDFYLNSVIFKKSVHYFENDSSLSFVGFNSYIYYENNRKLEKEDKFKSNIFITGKKYLMTFMIGVDKPTSTFTTVFDRAKLAEAIGNVQMLNDTVIYLRALLKGNAFLDSDYVGAYRVHQANITKSISSDFVLKNMDEKYKISKLLPFGLYAKSYWLANQAWISARYLLDSNASKKNRELINNWFLKKNLLVIYIYIYLKMKYFFFKKLKLLLRKGKDEV